jgi:hypothetical protein
VTRARDEVHLLYSGFDENLMNGKRYHNGPSEFLDGI